MPADLTTRQLAQLAQQARDNAALVQVRDEVRADSIVQALDNTDTPEAGAMRRKARTMLECLDLLEQKLRAMVDAGQG